MKSMKFIVTLLLSVVILCGCNNEKKQETFKIGALLSLHGDNDTQGKLAKNGILLAVEKINAAGGINGKQVELVVEDTYTDDETTFNGMKKLATIDSVQGIVVTGDKELPIVNQLADKYGIPVMATICTGMLDDYRSDYVYRYCYNEEQEDEYLMRFIREDLGVNNMALLYPKSDAGDAFYKYSKKYIDANTITVVADIKYDVKSSDQRDDALKVVKSNPDIVCARGFGSSLDALLKSIGEEGYQGRVAGDLSLSASELNRHENSLLDGAYIVASEFDLHSEDPAIKSYTDAYIAKYKKDPCFWDAIGYDSFLYLCYALKESKEKSVDFNTALFSIRPNDLLLGDNWFEDGDKDLKFNAMHIFEMKNGQLSKKIK